LDTSHGLWERVRLRVSEPRDLLIASVPVSDSSIVILAVSSTVLLAVALPVREPVADWVSESLLVSLSVALSVWVPEAVLDALPLLVLDLLGLSVAERELVSEWVMLLVRVSVSAVEVPVIDCVSDSLLLPLSDALTVSLPVGALWESLTVWVPEVVRVSLPVSVSLPVRVPEELWVSDSETLRDTVRLGVGGGVTVAVIVSEGLSDKEIL